MIKQVELGSVDKKNTPKKPLVRKSGGVSFGGIGDIALKGIQACEAHPMLNVSVLDLSTAILPRTFFETFIGSKQKDENGEEKKRKLNVLGGFEAFRRESSGLIINCLIPSFIVIGVAKLLNKPVMGGFNKSNLTRSWANGESIDKVQKYYLASKGKTAQERVYNTLKNMSNDIHGIDGESEKSFKDILLKDKKSIKAYDNVLRKTAESIVSGVKEEKITSNKTWGRIKKFFGIKSQKGYTDSLYEYVVKETGISENIRFDKAKGYSSSSLRHIYDSAGDMLHGIVKEGIENDNKQIEQYFKKAKKLVNVKSGLGLVGIIIPLAISAQPINRWITHKMSGKKGAPIYNDDKERILSTEEKTKLNAQKCVAVPLMMGVAGLSMLMDRPSLKMFQFKNIFPTMDQARIISAATFSSRIAAAEDSNELKENTIRDIATFSSFYFLGDYAAKGIATFLQKKNKDITLINRLKETPKNANIFQKFWNWAKHTTIKSSDELSAIKDPALMMKSTRLRAACQYGNLAFSLLSLGVFIPLYTRTQTNKKQKEKLAKASQNAGTPASFTSLAKSPVFESFTLVKQDRKAS